MSTGKAVLLFVLGIVFALLTFPVAFYVSAGLGYAFGIIAAILGAYLISKRGGRTIPLVLGIALIVLSLATLTGTAIVHMGIWTLEKAMKEITEITTVHGEFGKPVRVEDWEITVLDVKEAIYVKEDKFYYKAKEGHKVVVVTLRIKNVGKTTASPSSIWKFVLVTNAGKSYERAYTYELTSVYYVTGSIKSRAVTIRELDMFASLAPGTYIEGDLLFQIPENEKPVRLHFKVGLVGGYEVAIELIPP